MMIYCQLHLCNNKKCIGQPAEQEKSCEWPKVDPEGEKLKDVGTGRRINNTNPSKDPKVSR